MEENIINSFKDLFVMNPNIYARQQKDGKYRCVKSSVTNETIGNHLNHTVVNGHPFTIGLYAQFEGKCKWICLDTDKELLTLWNIGNMLESYSLPYHVEESRRGGHLWIFFDSAINVIPARKLVIRVCHDLGLKIKNIDANKEEIYDIEIFPHSDEGKGIGYLVRAPYGIHAKDGKVHTFITRDNQNIDLKDFLASFQRVTSNKLEQVLKSITNEKEYSQKDQMQLSPSCEKQSELRKISLRNEESTIFNINKVLDLRELILGYKIKVSSSGAFLCPFHDDQNASAGIFSNGELWTCHTCGTQGDAVEFYYQYEKLEHEDLTKKQAIRKLAKQLGIGWDGKSPYKEEIVPQPDPSSLISLEETQEQIKNTLEDFSKPANRNKVKLISTPSGTGRSTLTIDFINVKNQNNDFSFSWITARHKLDITGQQGWNHHYGRNKNNCLNSNINREISNKNWKPSGICQSCSYKEMCTYWKQFEDKTGIYPAEHLILNYPYETDLLVIDENPLDHLLSILEIKADDLQTASCDYPYLSVLFPTLLNVIGEPDLQNKFGKDIYTRLDAVLKTNHQTNLMDQLKSCQSQFHEKGIDYTKTSRYKVKQYPKHFVGDLLKLMEREVEIWNQNIDLSSELGIHNHNLIMTHLNRLGRSSNIPPIVILDATANIDLYKQVLKVNDVDALEINNVAKKSNVEIIQVKDTYYSSEALSRSFGSYHATIKKINYLREKYKLQGVTSLITYKDLAVRMSKELHINLVGWFGNQRGSNEFQHVDNLLVVGTPSISPFDVQRIGQAIWYGDKPLDLAQVHDKYFSFKDKRLQLIQEHYRENELYQTVNRARIFTSNKPKTIIVFSDVTMSKLQPTKIVTQFPNLSSDYLKSTNVSGTTPVDSSAHQLTLV